MKVVYFLHFIKDPSWHWEGILWIRFVGRTSVCTAARRLPSLLLIWAHCHITLSWFQESLRAASAGSGGGVVWIHSRYSVLAGKRFTDKWRADWWPLSTGFLPNLDTSFPGWRSLFPELVSSFRLLTTQIKKRLSCFVPGTALGGTKISHKVQGEKRSHP